jgi:two-component system OmpR family sensor kinase
MTLRAKIVALVLGLTVSLLAGLAAFLAGSWSGWSREAVERDLADRAEAIAALVEVKRHGEVELEHEGSPLLDDPAHPYRLAGPGGFTSSSGDLPWPPPEERTDLVRDRDGRAWRVVSRLLPAGEDERRRGREPVRIAVQVAGLDAPFGALEGRFRRGLLLALAAAVVLGGAGAALLAHLSLGPLRRLASEVDAIGASSLDRRVGAAGLDPELLRLASAFNDLLGRLDEAMQRQRQLVSRASHALRTPTATILTRAEVALRRERGAAEYREALGEIAAAARESAGLVSHLLTLSRLDERRRALQLEEVPLGEVAAELVRLLRPRADEAGIALEVEVPGDLAVTAERAALRELLEALLDNALHYTPRGGRAGVRAAAAPGGVTLAVWDTGPGIPPEERPRVLDRFRRGSAGEASGRPGSGLGLAIVKAIAEAHGAALSLGERAGGGLEVAVRFAAPRSPSGRAPDAAPDAGRRPEAGGPLPGPTLR